MFKIVGELFSCQRQERNSEYPYAVAVILNGNVYVVGHIPKLMSAACSLPPLRTFEVPKTAGNGANYLLCSLACAAHCFTSPPSAPSPIELAIDIGIYLLLAVHCQTIKFNTPPNLNSYTVLVHSKQVLAGTNLSGFKECKHTQHI